MRMIAVFNKGESVRFISHLDLQRAMQRALRRAELPVAYSKGFNPHSLLSFASAPPVGMLSVAEIMDVKLDIENEREDAPRMLERLNAVLPDDLFLSRACLVPDSAPSPMAVLEGADYELACAWTPEMAEKAVTAFLQSGEAVVEKKSKTGIKQVDIRPMVHELSVESKNGNTIIKARVSLCEKATVRPEMLIRALTASGVRCEPNHEPYSEPNHFDITRTLLLARSNNRFFPLIDVYRENGQ